MKVLLQAPRSKTFPATPTGIPSRRAAHAGLSPALFAANGKRIRYRVHLLWADPATPSGRREEVVEFHDPRKLLDLARRINTTPDRPLLSAVIEAKPLPKWERVTVDFLTWRAAERDRRGGGR